MHQSRNRKRKTVTLPILLPCSFAERDGFSNFLQDDEQWNPVRALTDEDLNLKSTRGKRIWALLTRKQKELYLSLVALKQAFDGANPTALSEAYERLASALI